MRFWRRGRSTGRDQRADARRAEAQRGAIAAFWRWWAAEGAAATHDALLRREPQRAAEPITDHVHAIDDGLAWELAAGTGSEHVLVVTCAGDPALRAVARRWRLAAPRPDATWDYSDVRLPSSDLTTLTLELGFASLDAASAVAEARVEGAALDVSVHHPGYPQLQPEQRDTATFLLLDAVLGEAAVETWLGSVSSSVTPPLDAVPLGGLRSVVSELRRTHTDEHGDLTWAVLSGRTPEGGAVIASAQTPLRPMTAPHLDTYVPVVVPFAERTDEGLPGPGSLTALRELEDQLRERLGGSGRVVAHQTHDGVRVLHLYVDGTTGAVEQVRAAVRDWPHGAVEVAVQADPAWDAVRHLRS